MSKTRTNSQKLYDIIKRPLVTDKAHQAMANYNQYTFEVSKDATKTEIKKAVELIFPGKKVKAVKTVYMPSHEKRMGLKYGRTDSGKKAIVTIVGDPIEELTGV